MCRTGARCRGGVRGGAARPLLESLPAPAPTHPRVNGLDFGAGVRAKLETRLGRSGGATVACRRLLLARDLPTPTNAPSAAAPTRRGTRVAQLPRIGLRPRWLRRDRLRRNGLRRNGLRRNRLRRNGLRRNGLQRTGLQRTDRRCIGLRRASGLSTREAERCRVAVGRDELELAFLAREQGPRVGKLPLELCELLKHRARHEG